MVANTGWGGGHLGEQYYRELSILPEKRTQNQRTIAHVTASRQQWTSSKRTDHERKFEVAREWSKTAQHACMCTRTRPPNDSRAPDIRIIASDSKIDRHAALVIPRSSSRCCCLCRKTLNSREFWHKFTRKRQAMVEFSTENSSFLVLVN